MSNAVKIGKRFDRNPVFDEAELEKIVKAGVNRLTAMQLGDGGWGWFSGWGERSTPHTTAVVVHGLLVAKSNGVAIVPSVLERGVAWLENYQTKQTKLLKGLGHTQRRKTVCRQHGRFDLPGSCRGGARQPGDACVFVSRPYEAGCL